MDPPRVDLADCDRMCSAIEALTRSVTTRDRDLSADGHVLLQSLGMCPLTIVGYSFNVNGGTLIGRQVPTLQHHVAVSPPTSRQEQGRLAVPERLRGRPRASEFPISAPHCSINGTSRVACR